MAPNPVQAAWNAILVAAMYRGVLVTLHDWIRGFDPLEDAAEYGRTLLPLTRRLAAEREAQPTLAAE